MTDWVVSQSDVEKHPKFNSIGLDEILYSYGMEVSKGYEIDSEGTVEEGGKPLRYHRSAFTDEVHCCTRYVGTAREDGRWKRFTETFVML